MTDKNNRRSPLVILAILGVLALSLVLTPTGTPSEEIVQAQEPSVYKGLDVLFLVDQSGSMGGRLTGSEEHPDPNDPLGLRFVSPQHFVTLLGEDRLQVHPDATYRVAVIHFGDSPRPGMDWQLIAPASWEEWKAQKAELVDVLLAPGKLATTNLGNTDFLDAFEAARRAFQGLLDDQPGPRRRVLIVLTDGQPCVAPSPPVPVTLSPEVPTPTPLPPCLPIGEHMRDLIAFTGENFPASDYTIYVVAMNDSQDNYWPRMEKYWQQITGNRAGKVVRNKGDVAKRFREILLDLVKDLPPKTEVVDTFIVPGPVTVEPYLESIEFTFYKTDVEERLLVYDQSGTLLEPEKPNVAVQGADAIIETVTVYQPQPGQWQVETTSKSSEVDIAKRQVRARGVLRSPLASQIQYVPVELEWRLEDSRGAALPEYTDTRYRLQAVATISAGGQSWPLTLVAKGNSTYATTFTPVIQGTHIIHMEAKSQDLEGKPITVFSGEVGRFEVGPVMIVPHNLPLSHPQFAPLSLEYVLQDRAGRAVGVQSPVLISATISASGQQWMSLLQARADGVFAGDFVPVVPGSHSVQMVATLLTPSGETRVLSEQGGGQFTVVQPAVSPRSPVGPQPQHLPMTISYEVNDGLGNPFVVAPGWQVQFTATLRTGGQVGTISLLPTAPTVYTGVFTPTLAGLYDLEARAQVLDPEGNTYTIYQGRGQLSVVPTVLLDFAVLEPRDLTQEVRNVFFKPLPMVLEVQLQQEAGQPVNPAGVLSGDPDQVFTVKVYDSRHQDRSADLSLKPTGIPGVFRAESQTFGIGRYEITVDVVAQPRSGYTFARRSQTLATTRIENRMIRLAEILGPILLVVAVAAFLGHRRYIAAVTAHPCRGTLVIQDAYGKPLWTKVLGDRNRIVLKRKEIHPVAHLSRLEVTCNTEDESKNRKVHITAISDRGIPVLRNELFGPGARRKLGAYEVYLVKDPGVRTE